MTRSLLGLSALLAAVVITSCSADPSLTITIADQAVRTGLGSSSERTACSGVVRDAPYNAPLNVVRGVEPATIQLRAGQGATEIRGWIYEVQGQGPPTSGPIEEFRLQGSSGTFVSRSIVAARTYDVVVNIPWSFLISQGEVTHVFRLRLEPGG